MASIKQCTDKAGNAFYKVTASCGRGRRVTRSWHPEAGWSRKTIERELNKFAATLENSLQSNEVVTRQEQIEIDRQAAIEAAKLKTLRQYADCVFMPAKEATFSENARSSYRMFLDKHIFPSLGDLLLTEITPAMLTKLLLDFQKAGYAHATTIKLYNVLNGVFQMAFLDDTIPFNPMLKVKRPAPRKAEQIETVEQAYTVDEMKFIFSCLEKEPLKWRVFVRLLADTGIRRGEACGLCWDCVNFTDNTVTIKRNLQYTPAKGVYMETPKNGKSRLVDVDTDIMSMLRDLRNSQSAKAISRYVFTQENSFDPMHPQTPTRYFKKFGQRYGIKDFHPHKLRHTSASIAITHGADVVSVSERLGHSDTSVTLRMYAHANEESIRRAGQIARDALKQKQA